jgi:hypothetical protein
VISSTRPAGRVAVFAVAAAMVVASACSDFTGVPASLPTMADSGTAYAINGAPLGAPTALYVFGGALVNADANFLFDVAFDLDANGGIVVLPQRDVASALASTHTVALQVDSTHQFDEITRAPASGYRADTAVTVRRNQVVLAQVTDLNACTYSLTGSTVYAKFVVRAINREARTLEVRYTVDPNCGFRSFTPGVPKD